MQTGLCGGCLSCSRFPDLQYLGASFPLDVQNCDRIADLQHQEGKLVVGKEWSLWRCMAAQASPGGQGPVRFSLALQVQHCHCSADEQHVQGAGQQQEFVLAVAGDASGLSSSV